MLDGLIVQTTPIRVVTALRESLVSAAPKFLAGLLFLTVAYVGIEVALKLVRLALDRIYADEQELIVNLVTTIVAVFLWFGAALSLLKIVGMGDIAASLGTATGFIALGISYALSNMIADTVAGVYLLRDPDFNIGDRVTAESTTGTVKSIELRKSRLELDDGNTVIIANSDVEKRWTKLTATPEKPPIAAAE